MQNSAPPAGWVRAVTRPPCSSAIRRATDSPSPVPWTRVVWSASKRRSGSPGGRPGPRSRTRKTSWRPSASAVARTRAPSGDAYAAKGERTLRNAGDGIYQQGGSQLVLSVTDDGAGGYVATFEIGVDASRTTTTTTTPAGGTTTTTTIGTAVCSSTAACLASLQSALPDPAASTRRPARRTAQDLQRRANRVSAVMSRAASASGGRQRRLLARAENKLEGLLAASERAATRDTLGVALAPIQSAIEALLDLV
jgi:hypothetical protein